MVGLNLSSDVSSESVSVRSIDRIDLTNRTIGPFRVLHRLGSGGMSDVYLAFQENLQRHVALKVMRMDLASSAEHLKRFLQEARAAASMVHPNIVQVYDVGDYQSIQFIAQEYIAGSSLRSYIQRMGSLSVEETVSILLQVSAALSKSASIGIVHRDIKPDNILLTTDGEVKVTDFGLARAYSSKENLTEIGIALGTPTYMSPEQIQGQAVDFRSDLYSLGVTAYHMLSGRPPFQGDTALSLAVQHVQNKVPNLAELRPDVPKELIAIVERLLEKKPEDRFVSPNELNRALRTVAESLPRPFPTDLPLPLPNVVIDQAVVTSEHTAALQRATTQHSRLADETRRKLIRGTLALIGIVAAGFAAYSVTAFTPQRRLLPEPTPIQLGMPRQSSVQDQYALALLKDSPAYWAAVEQYFSPTFDEVNKAYCMKAWLHMAWYELRLEKPEAAAKWINKIRSYPSIDNIVDVLTSATEHWKANLEGNKEAASAHKSMTVARYQLLGDRQKTLVNEIMPRELRVVLEGL